MEYVVGTRCERCTLHVRILSRAACQIRLTVYDPSQPHTVLGDRVVFFDDAQTQDCYLPLPTSAWETRLRIDSPVGQGGVFDVLEVKKVGLLTFLDVIDWRNPEIYQGIMLGNRFCYNLGALPTLPPGKAYCSPDKSLRIKYEPILRSVETGQESLTPMRISSETAIMEASQHRCLPFTVAGRAAMFFHEFSHKFENTHPEWELEADLNGLTIYLALGYSRYEAIEVYQTVFHKVDTDENRERLEHIKDFISNFEFYIKKSKKQSDL